MRVTMELKQGTFFVEDSLGNTWSYTREVDALTAVCRLVKQRGLRYPVAGKVLEVQNMNLSSGMVYVCNAIAELQEIVMKEQK